MKEKIKVGVVCLARTTFDYQAAGEIYNRLIKDLKKRTDVEFVFIEELIYEVKQAQEAGERLARSALDGIIVISGTFHLGHLVLELDKRIGKPILLWGLNELPYNGGKIRLNSVCGVNLDASNLYKSGNKRFQYIIGPALDESWLDALRIEKALKDAHIGIAGFRAHGFFNLSFNELTTARETGVLLDHYELADIYRQPVEKEEIKRYEAKIHDCFTSSLSTEQFDKLATLTAKIRMFMEENSLTALAVRCWPEFARDFGIAPCAAMSILQSEGYILGCEGDVEGALSLLAHRAVGAETPFLADLSQVNLEENYALLWHCGVAPCNLWDRSSICSLDTYFAGGKGITADFVLRSGKINILRFDSAEGKYRIFMEQGEVLPMEKLLKGTYAKVRFQRPLKKVLNSLVYNGIAHHVSMAYGDYTAAFSSFARLKGWEVIE